MAAPKYAPDPEVRRAGLQHLRAEMAGRHLTQQGLADLAGISRATVQAVLSNVRRGTGGSQVAIAEALDANPGLYFPRTAFELEQAEAATTGFCS